MHLDRPRAPHAIVPDHLRSLYQPIDYLHHHSVLELLFVDLFQYRQQ